MPASPHTPGSLHVVPCAELDAAQQRQLARIYAEAFPADLRVPLAELAEPSQGDQLLVALDGADPVGFAALRLLDRAGWTFLRYYGVAADRRRQRLGLRFWRQLTASVGASAWPGRIAFEVEDPAGAQGDLAEQAVRRGRIRFWESCGAVSLPVPAYVMPAMTKIGEAEPMILMAAGPDRPGSIGPDNLAALVRAIYTEHYGLAPEHPLAVAARASIGSGRG